MRTTRRDLVPSIAPRTASLIATLALACGGAAPVMGQTVDIKLAFDKSQQCRVVSEYAHEGDVILLKSSKSNSDNQSQTQALPLDVRAEMDFYQRYTGNQTENQAIRFYKTAESSIRVDKGNTAGVLKPTNRHIVTRIAPKANRRIQVASLGGALQQSELDLLRNPGDPLTVPGLVNRNGLFPGDKWDAPAVALADFLAVDQIVSSDVKLLLKSIENGQAKIYLAGKVEAGVDDVTTRMEVTGILQADLRKQALTSVRLGIREDRKRGQLAPGFRGRTRVDTRLTHGQSSEQLATAMIKRLTSGKKVQQRLKWVSDTGHFKLQYDPAWRLITSEKETAILRYLNEGESMAQCSVVRLPSRPADNPLTLAAFKNEVAKIVSADEHAALESAKQFKSRSGLSVLEVQISGLEQEVPLNWMYFHVSGKDGRCVTFVFTLEEELASDVRPVARQLVNNLTFLTPQKARPANAQARKHQELR